MEIRRHDLTTLDAGARRALRERVQQGVSAEVAETVAEVVEAVREAGDAALLRYTERFDGVRLSAGEVAVTAGELEAAGGQLDADVRAAVETAVSGIRAHHDAQRPPADWMRETHPGVVTGERSLPIPSAGLYVPRGKGSFPSVMAMLTVPASIAGVEQIVVCTPPGPDGEVDAASLYAARLNGVETVLRVGGAQAIAALAYGTESVPKVEKIVGPGNQYVTYAKRLVYGVVDPGAPAGPSESIVLADGDADPRTAAIELLVEAEHGPDSAALLVTDSAALADAVAELLPALVDELPEPRREFCTTVLRRYGGIVAAADFDDAVAFCNEWAPEHLHVLAAEPFDVLGRIRNAGEVLLGPRASIAIGNYVAGVNAILPTGGFARSYSCVGVADFVKRSSYAYVSDRGAGPAAAAAATLADYEGFPAHARAARHAG